MVTDLGESGEYVERERESFLFFGKRPNYIDIDPLVDVIANRAPTSSARESHPVHSKTSLVAIRQTSAAPDVCYWQRELAHAGQSRQVY